MTNEQAIKEFKKHCLKEFPNEACGFVIGGEFVACANRSATPKEDFIVDFPSEGNVECFLHSHPNGNLYPSERDMEFQINSGIPWGIVVSSENHTSDVQWFGDQCPIPPLIGRQFVHGITDCYSLIRDYYRINFKINLKDFARDNEWWYKGKNLYEEGFQKAGFHRITLEELQPHDVVLCMIRSKVVNHGGVYIGQDTWVHHLFNKLSRRDQFSRWVQKYAVYFLRHEEI